MRRRNDPDSREIRGCVLRSALVLRNLLTQGQGRSAEAHYDCMSLDAIKALPVADWAAPGCVLFLWATDPLLPAALDVIGAWGFVYKTVAFTWAKTTKDGTGWPIGCGYWTRANPEMCLLATRGHPERLSRSVRQLLIAPRRQHSQKPDEAYERIEALCPGPYLEMFARGRAERWDSWGLRVLKLGRSRAGGGQTPIPILQHDPAKRVQAPATGRRAQLVRASSSAAVIQSSWIERPGEVGR